MMVVYNIRARSDNGWNVIEMIEKWKQVVGFEGLYEISNLGRVKSLPRFKTSGGIMSPIIDGIGYLGVNLCKNNRRYRRKIHRMILEAFIGPCPCGMEGCHNDDNKTHNNLFNLRWDTHRNNIQDAQINGRGFSRGSHHGRAKLTETQIRKIKQLFQSGQYMQKEIADLFGISRSNISCIIRNKTWTHIR